MQGEGGQVGSFGGAVSRKSGSAVPVRGCWRDGSVLLSCHCSGVWHSEGTPYVSSDGSAVPRPCHPALPLPGPAWPRPPHLVPVLRFPSGCRCCCVTVGRSIIPPVRANSSKPRGLPVVFAEFMVAPFPALALGSPALRRWHRAQAAF